MVIDALLPSWSRLSLGVVLSIGLSLSGCMPAPNATEEPTAAPTTSAEPSVESQASPSPTEQAESTAMPETKTAMMSIEGESEEITLQLYDEPTLPVTIYLPEGDFTPELAETEEGTGVQFYWTYNGQKDDKAYIQLAFPKNQVSVSELEAQITGDSGLMASNGWTMLDRTEQVPYSWATEAIAYEGEAEGEPTTGYILLGEHNGSAFYASTHFPLEYGDGFGPRADLVLENLNFRE